MPLLNRDDIPYEFKEEKDERLYTSGKHWALPKREVERFHEQNEAWYETAKYLGELQCQQNKSQSNSTISSDISSPNTNQLPEWWLSRKKEPLKEGYVRQRRAGRYLERRVVNYAPSGGHIRKLPHEPNPFDIEIDENGNEVQAYFRPYVLKKNINVDPETGEEFIFHDDIKFMRDKPRNGMENPRRIARSCDNLKWLVRANERKIRLFVTLTYAENMQDTKRLYEDFRRFWMRLKYHFPSVSGYLVAFEPQKRGAWHAHVLLTSDDWRLRIPNKRMYRIWGHGFTKTKKPGNIHDIGSYLTTYLTDIKSGKRTKKGARLYLYKAGFHFMRHSRNGISYCDTTRWYGQYNSIPELEHSQLMYEHINTRKLPSQDILVTQLVAFELDKDYYNAYF